MVEDRYKTRDFGNIFRTIYSQKQCTRQQLADILGISLPTVTYNLNLLRESGLIYNAGAHQSTGGRKAHVFQCVSDARYALGIDITKHHLSLVLININLDIIAKKRIRCKFTDSDEYFENLRQEIEQLLSRNETAREKFLGIGISMPVIINQDQKTISYATVLRLSGNIYDRMAPYIKYPFLLFNDANSAGLAESWFSDSKDSVTYLFLGNSVGGARMIGHQIDTGVNWRGGEFGHMCIVPNGQMCYCGQKGCLDAYCSAKVLSDFTNENLSAFFEELKKGENQGYKKVFDQYLDYLAIAVKNLRMCFDSDIILGGAVGAFMGDYIEEFRKKAAVLNPFEQNADYIQVCHYRTEAAAVGAAIYYINEFIEGL